MDWIWIYCNSPFVKYCVKFKASYHVNRLPESYEIIFGSSDNTKVSILKNVATVAETDFPGVLDCDELRRFWINWQDGVLIVYDYVYFACSNWNYFPIEGLFPEKNVFSQTRLHPQKQLEEYHRNKKIGFGGKRFKVSIDQSHLRLSCEIYEKCYIGYFSILNSIDW